MNISKFLGPVSNIEFDKLFLGQLFSHFSDAILQFILISILMETLPVAGKAIAITFFIFLLPQFLFSPFTGAICDKFSRKKILAFSALYRSLVLCLFKNRSINSKNLYNRIFIGMRKHILLSCKNVNIA